MYCVLRVKPGPDSTGGYFPKVWPLMGTNSYDAVRGDSGLSDTVDKVSHLFCRARDGVLRPGKC